MPRRSDDGPGDDLLSHFLRLSRRLTGTRRLPHAVAKEYLAETSGDSGDDLRRLLTLEVANPSEDDFAAELARAPDSVRALAHKLILLWYTGRPAPDKPPLSADAYAASLLFEVIGAHAPAISGGYFGYSRYPPER